jgi:hypothetical protein
MSKSIKKKLDFGPSSLAFSPVLVKTESSLKKSIPLSSSPMEPTLLKPKKKTSIKTKTIKSKKKTESTSIYTWWNFSNVRDLYDVGNDYQYRFPGGIYVIAPNTTGEPYGPVRPLVKIGIARDLEHRLNSYKTPWPNGAQHIFLLVMDNAGTFRNLTLNDEHEFELTKPSEETDLLLRLFLEEIEQNIFEELKDYRYTCIDNNHKERSTCEWFHAHPEIILHVLIRMLIKYNGAHLKDEQDRQGKAQFRLFVLLPDKKSEDYSSIPPLLVDVEDSYSVKKKQFPSFVVIASNYLTNLRFTLKDTILKKTISKAEPQLNKKGFHTPATPSFSIEGIPLKTISEVLPKKRKPAVKKMISADISTIIPM